MNWISIISMVSYLPYIASTSYSIVEDTKHYTTVGTKHKYSEMECVMYCTRLSSYPSFENNICKCLNEVTKQNETETKSKVNIYKPVKQEILLSEQKPGSLSSIYGWLSKYAAKQAFDGNLIQSCKDGCAHTNEALINWLQVDLQQEAVTYRVKIYNRNEATNSIFSSRLRNAKIHIADSKDMTSNKQLCASFLSITTTNQIESFDCSVPMVGRYVRLTQEHSVPDNLNISEMQVWGYYP